MKTIAVYRSFLHSALTSMIFICCIVCANAQEMPVVTCRHLFDIQAGFTYPTDVTVSPAGTVHIVDGVNQRIAVFDSDGKPLDSHTTSLASDIAESAPVGITSDADGRLFVADPPNRCIKIYDKNGLYITSLKAPQKDALKPFDPVDAAVDTTLNRCYVVDNDNHRIVLFDLDKPSVIDIRGKNGEKPGEFQYPFLCSMDTQSTLYVVDVLNTRVQAFNTQGRTMSIIGKWGVDRGEFYRPKGVTVDNRDRIFVTDSYLGVVQVFKRFRTFIGVLADQKGTMLRFNTPVGIHADTLNRLFIVEMKSNTVRVYQLTE